MPLIPVNHAGLLINEGHPNHKLTDADVDRLRQMHEVEGFSYGTLAVEFGISKSAVAMICRYERRGQTPDRWKKEKAHAR